MYMYVHRPHRLNGRPFLNQGGGDIRTLPTISAPQTRQGQAEGRHQSILQNYNSELTVIGNALPYGTERDRETASLRTY